MSDWRASDWRAHTISVFDDEEKTPLRRAPLRLRVKLATQIFALASLLTVYGVVLPVASRWTHSELEAGGRAMSEEAKGELQPFAELPVKNVLTTAQEPLAELPVGEVFTMARRPSAETPVSELFTMDELQSGGVVLYVVGILYMFLVIAITCDEYLVPALDVMVQRFEISPAIAGATFMAAGGSAPELFVSLIGTMYGSDIGVGTVVGSAALNMLLVVGTCAVFARETLSLTWWPILRDSVCCSLALLAVAAVLGILTPSRVELWEAGALLGLYACYCLLMPRHQTLRRSSLHVELLEEGESHVTPPEAVTECPFLVPFKVRPTVRESLLDPEAVEDACIAFAFRKLKRAVASAFGRLDVDGNGFIEAAAVRQLLEELGHSECSEAMIEALDARLDQNEDGKISFFEFDSWYVARALVVEQKLTRAFRTCDSNGDGTVDEDGAKNLLEHLNPIQLQGDYREIELENAVESLLRKSLRSRRHRAKMASVVAVEPEAPNKEALVGPPAEDVAPNKDDVDNDEAVRADAAAYCSDSAPLSVEGEPVVAEDLSEDAFIKAGRRSPIGAQRPRSPSGDLRGNQRPRSISREMRPASIKPLSPQGQRSRSPSRELRPATLKPTPLPPQGQRSRSPTGELRPAIIKSTPSSPPPSPPSAAPPLLLSSPPPPHLPSLPPSPPSKEDSFVYPRRSAPHSDTPALITMADFRTWYLETPYWEEKMKVADKDVDDAMDLSCCPSPDTSAGIGALRFFLILPIVTCLKLTLPDVKEGTKAYWYPVTLVGALAWVAIASYSMVTWAAIVANVFGIPHAVLGLTFLAAGTSVPDLLTAVIVAQQGEADAAASFVVGRSVFDVLVGLPLPWLVYNLYYGQAAVVGAESLFGSLLILFSMVALITCTIACFGWRMTRCLGYCLFLFYAAFIAQDFARAQGLLVIPGF